MATQIVQAPASADHPTAPLPPAAAAALARLESALLPSSAVDVLARHAVVARTCRELSASTAWMAAGEFDRLADVQDELAMRRHQLETAGRLDLLDPAS